VTVTVMGSLLVRGVDDRRQRGETCAFERRERRSSVVRWDDQDCWTAWTPRAAACDENTARRRQPG